MRFNLHAAESFMATNARLLDRRRLQLLLGTVDPRDALDALDAYRNADGGYGSGLEPDLRAAESQPAAAMHALEVLAEAAPAAMTRAVELFDWLEKHTLADGGLPFALPIADPAGCAPFWTQGEPATSSLQMTAQVAANAHRLGHHHPGLVNHPWLMKATTYCVDAIRGLDHAPHAYELLFALRFLDAVAENMPDAENMLDADALVKHLGRHLPPGGSMHVKGGTEAEMLNPLDFAPHPGGPVRALLAGQAVATDIERLAREQQPDGGWLVDFASYSPAAALEWRGYATVRAVQILQSNSS
jgi:hypothetical protein